MKIGQIGLVWLLCCAPGLVTADENKAEVDKKSDIALRHVLFAQFQDMHREAYLTAEYYKQRDLSDASIQLTQAAASMELGFLNHGRALIEELEQGSLLPENQSRLRLYLARDAYRRRDWPLLESHLASLSDLNESEAKPRESNGYEAYLHAELARYLLDKSAVTQYLSEIPINFRLRRYAIYNSAVMFAELGERETALSLLQELADVVPSDLAELMLVDRSRIAIAELHISANEFDLARSALGKVSVKHEYGPYALAQIARLDMQAERYDGAAKVWQYLVDHYPWHRAATHSASGLGFALQETRGEEAAFAVYTAGLSRSKAHEARLAEVQEFLVQNLNDPEHFVAGDDSVLLWLSEAFGHDEWLSWYATAEVRQMARRWQALESAYQNLLNGQENLALLLQVDQEQQARIQAANQSITNLKLDEQIASIRSETELRRHNLSSSKLSYDQDLSLFASEVDWSLLTDIRLLGQRLQQGLTEIADSDSADVAALLDRVARLEGLVRYRVFERLPRTRQQKVSALDGQLLLAEQAEDRMHRVRQAAQRQPESVSARIHDLSQRRALLQGETLLALRSARQELLLALNEYIEVDRSLLAAQQAGYRYDITRLVDRRLAGGEAK